MYLETGSRLQNYEIVRKVGAGGMGEVYQARDVHLDRLVAIKALNPRLTQETDLRLRFQNEAKIQARLYHPNIVGLFEYIEQDDGSYIVMEFATGSTLKDILASSVPLLESRAVNILGQILSALAYAHSQEVLHRDIKPSNIMVGDSDKVKVMDFGIARIMGSGHLTGTGLKVGTLFYMSPEQIITPRDVDLRSDIYSAGIVMYEMLCGRLPFALDDTSEYRIQKEIVENQLPDPRGYNPRISASLADLVKRMTAKDPSRRPPIASLLAALSSGQGQIIGGNAGSTWMMPQPGRSEYPGQSKPAQSQFKSEKNLWSSKGRISTKTYWFRWLICWLIFFAMTIIYAAFSEVVGPLFQGYAILVVNLVIECFMIIQGVKRMHDVDKSGWYLLIPIYSLILTLTPGTAGPNRFGPCSRNF